MPLQFILTTAGKNAVVNANNTGTNPVVIDRVAIGTASWAPTAAATALSAEIKKITAIGGGAVADDTIHVTAQDSSADAYVVKEIGLYTSGNVLLAIYSQVDAIITKGAATVALIAADLVITGIPAGSVTVGDTTFDYPQATETVKGVAELATTAEAQAGTDDQRIITPKKLQDVTATEARKGVVELATTAEVQTGTDTARAITPAGLTARTATEARTGVIQLATQAEVQVGTDAVKAVTPATLTGFVVSQIIPIASDAETQAGVISNKAVSPAGLTSRTATETRTGVVELATSTEVQTGTDVARAVTPAGLASRTATEARTGVARIATSAEAQAGIDDTLILTPLKLQAVTATETRKGVVELATSAEVIAGTDAVRAITPAGLAARQSSSTLSGLIEIATSAEVQAGTDTERAVVPNTLRLYPGTCRAWVNFDASGTVSITSSHGVSSITDRGTGRFTINWDGVFGSSIYAYVACARQINDVDDSCTVSPRLSDTKTTSALQITVTESSGLLDSSEICVAAFA